MNLDHDNVIGTFKGPHASLSNFFPVKVQFEGLEYPSVEHAFQAAKTLDEGARALVAQAPDAGTAKKIGKALGVQRRHWAEVVRFKVMEELLALKFDADLHPDMVSDLLATGNAVLIEGNHWHDNVWGSCLCDKCGRRGANALGRMLMKLRAEL